jgi:hypothetical protein
MTDAEKIEFLLLQVAALQEELRLLTAEFRKFKTLP